MRLRHSVYVVELDRDVLNEHRFRQANPEYDGHSPCVYVGMTGLAPAERFRNHKLGHKGNRFVELYGLRLLPQVYACFNPMPYRGAQQMERELAQDLRERGWAVWQA